MLIASLATHKDQQRSEAAHAGDAELLAWLQQDSHGAATLLFERFGRLVNHTVQRVLGPDPDHDDVVNEVFLRAIGGVSKVRDPGKLSSWMVSVTLNTVRSELRARVCDPRSDACGGAVGLWFALFGRKIRTRGGGELRLLDANGEAEAPKSAQTFCRPGAARA
ncbi:MAG: sigma-70 family RNA polymerase sigma factor [Deltaproteobacteria bacterium]|nr:sigma-70 family RNA polymerase sigma factor [Deltaproteobacteria bacterium]